MALTTIGMGVVVFGLILVFVMAWRKESLSAGKIMALSLASVAGGFTIANLTTVTQLKFAGEGQTITAQVRQDVQTVQTKATEVQDLAAQVKNVNDNLRTFANSTAGKISDDEKNVSALAKQASSANDLAAASAKQSGYALKRARAVQANVVVMQGNIQQTWRSLLDAVAIAMLTRNQFPPPKAAADQIDAALNQLAIFAYPNAMERQKAIARIMAFGQK